MSETGSLTKDTDTAPDFVGGAGNDTFIAASTDTDDDGIADINNFNGIDTLDGGAGTDTLRILDTTAALDVNGDNPSASISNIEIIEVQSATDFTMDTSDWDGVTNLNVTKGADVAVTVADTTAVTASGITGALIVVGGSTQTVTSAGGAMDVSGAAGAVSVTHTDMTADLIVRNGSDVSVTVTESDAVGDIIIGDTTANTAVTAAEQATGTVTVTATNNTTATTANADLDATMSNIYVDGGTTITVSQSASASDELTNTTGGTVTQGNVVIAAGEETTTVTVTQDATVTENPAVEAEAAVAQTQTITFEALASGETTIINGLTFTASKNLTAAEVAAAFANLTATDTQDNGGVVENGIYTGTFGGGFTSGDASGAVVVFTETVAGTNAVAMDVDNGDVDPATPVLSADGNAATPAEDGILGKAAGTVTILDTAATAAMTTVTVDGYATGSSIGVLAGVTTRKADALTTLSLANSDAGAAFAVATAATELDLTVNNVDGSLSLDHNGNATNNGDATVATLTVTTATADSVIALQAQAVTDLTVNGTQELDLTGSDLAALETVVVSGTAKSVILDGTVAAVLESIDASATSGDVTASIDTAVALAADVATAYLGGSGSDTVTLLTDTLVDADIDLGEGDDKLILTASTTAITASVVAGLGTDILSMDATTAESLDDESDLLNATGFERVEITSAATAGDIDVATMGFNYVIVDGVTDVDAALDVFTVNLDSASTLDITAIIGDGNAVDADNITVVVTDADTGLTDSLNIKIDAEDAGELVGTVIADNVESLSIEADDLNADGNADGATSFTASGDKVTSITVTGDADLTLTTDSTVLATINATAMTGGLTYTVDSVANDIAVSTGSGVDEISVESSSNAQIKTGDGADTILVDDEAASANVWGQGGIDTFDMTSVISSATQYVTIEDLTSGEQVLINTDRFIGDEVAITDFDEMSLTDKFDAILTDDTLNDASSFATWFVHNNNTYIVVSDGDDTNELIDATINDQVIKLTGTFDLSADASFNVNGTLEIA